MVDQNRRRSISFQTCTHREQMGWAALVDHQTGRDIMTYSGRCQCGAVSAEIAGEPVAIRQCWCRQCQQLAAGGPTHNAMFRTNDVALRGELSTHAYVAASGNTLTQSFCCSCGTPVMAQSYARPQFCTMRLGFLQEGTELQPQMAIWTKEAPRWAQIDPGLEQHPQQPPPPQPSATFATHPRDRSCG